MNFDIKKPNDVLLFNVAVAIRFQTSVLHNKNMSLDKAIEFYDNKAKERGLPEWYCLETLSKEIPIKGIVGDGFIKDKKGIYIFMRNDKKNLLKRICYIGKSNKIRQRLFQHYYNPLVYNKAADMGFDFEVYAYYVHDNETLERLLIEKHKPILNVHYS